MRRRGSGRFRGAAGALTTSAVLLMLSLFAGAAPAFAAPSVTVRPQSGAPGSQFTISGRGYQQGSQVVAGWDPGQADQAFFGFTNVGADGSFTMTARVPNDAAVGPHQVVVQSPSGPVGAPFTVTSPSQQPPPAVTSPPATAPAATAPPVTAPPATAPPSTAQPAPVTPAGGTSSSWLRTVLIVLAGLLVCGLLFELLRRLGFLFGRTEKGPCPQEKIDRDRAKCHKQQAQWQSYLADLDRLYAAAVAAMNAYNAAVDAFNATINGPNGLQAQINASNTDVGNWNISREGAISYNGVLGASVAALQDLIDAANQQADQIAAKEPKNPLAKYAKRKSKPPPWGPTPCFVPCNKPQEKQRNPLPAAHPLSRPAGPLTQVNRPGGIPAGGKGKTHQRCPCTFTTVKSETKVMNVGIHSHSDPSGSTCWIDATERHVALSAEAEIRRALTVTGADSEGAADITTTLVVPIEHFEFTWQVHQLRVTDPRGAPLKPSVRMRGSLDRDDIVCSTGVTARGTGVVVTIDLADFYVDWLEPSADGPVLKGKLADFKLQLYCNAVPRAGGPPITRQITLTARGDKRRTRPNDFFDLTMTAHDPSAAPDTKNPTIGDMELIDPNDRDETCEPDAGWRVAELRCEAPPGLARRTVTSGQVLVLEARSLIHRHWSVYPENPGCKNKVVKEAETEERTRAETEWSIPAGAPLQLLGRCGPDSAVFYATKVDEPTECTITATTQRLEKYVDPSGHGPFLGSETATFTVTVEPCSLHVELVDVTGKPFADRHYRLVVDGSEPVSGVLGADGMLEAPVDPGAAGATLELSEHPDADRTCVFDLSMGDLFSINSQTGVRSRFNNLGLAAGLEEGGPDGSMENRALAMRALQRFQTRYGLTTGSAVNQTNVSGVVDDRTRAELTKVYDGHSPQSAPTATTPQTPPASTAKPHTGIPIEDALERRAPEVLTQRRVRLAPNRTQARLQKHGNAGLLVVPADPTTIPTGWYPTEQGLTFSEGNEVKYLVDGHDTFAEMARVIRTATTDAHFIYLLAWWLDYDLLLDGTPGGSIRSLFVEADRAGVEVRLMLYRNKTALLSEGYLGKGQDFVLAQESTVRSVNDLIHGAAVLDSRVTLTGAHHQKVLVVNGADGLTAFCGGVDINPDRVSHPSGEHPGSPMHDVHCRLRGPAAHAVLGTFVERWQDHPDTIYSSGRKIPLRGANMRPPVGAGVQYVGIGKTYANGSNHPLPGAPPLFSFAPQGLRSARALILQAISRASQFVYIEDQYFFSDDAVLALAAALQRGIKHVTVLLTWPSYLVPLMDGQREAGIQWLRKAGAERLRICFLSPEAGAHTYVHAKVTIVDDEFVSIGSANYNRRSFTNDSEIVAGILDQHTDGDIVFNLARRLRIALWAEHLNMKTPSGYAELADGVASAVHFLDPPPGAHVVPFTEPTDPAYPFPLSGGASWDLIDPDGS